MDISPFAPASFPDLPAISGVRLAAGVAEVRYKGRPDVCLVALDAGTVAAGVFTRSLTRSAPVDWCRDALKKGEGAARLLVVNSGNSNAFTGQAGVQSVARTVQAGADLFDCKKEEVFIASTGVIGEILPDEKITNILPQLREVLTSNAWEEANQAIMTTDTYPKGATRQVALSGGTVTLNGFAKGSGMIAPDLATMLAYMFTDAPIAAPLLQRALNEAVDPSFNAVTIDSDTSTSDSVMLFATGQAPMPQITDAESEDYRLFASAVKALSLDLAILLAKDGEGISKFLTVTVTGADSDIAAKKIAFSIANSPLVKTALAGEDPNWGRVVMAVGKSGEAADRDKLKIQFGPFLVAENGAVASSYAEEKGASYMKNSEIVIAVDVGIGSGAATVYGSDLTHAYISINADYRS